MIEYYYIDKNKDKVGPVPFEELIKKDLTVDTPICIVGREQWVPAYEFPELRFLFETRYEYDDAAFPQDDLDDYDREHDGFLDEDEWDEHPYPHDCVRSSYTPFHLPHVSAATRAHNERVFRKMRQQEEEAERERELEKERWRRMTHMNRTEDYDRIDDEEDEVGSGEYHPASFWGILVFVALCLLCGILFLIID